MTDEMKQDVLRVTANKFFPDAQVRAGLIPDPWVQIVVGSTIVETHVPRFVSDDDFEVEVFDAIKKLRDDLTMADAADILEA